MLRADMVVTHAPRFVHGEFDHALGAGRQAEPRAGGSLPAPDDVFDHLAHPGLLDAQIPQDLGGRSFFFVG